ncbi:MAG: sulfatase [Omnitrophica bacterium]|nr:sulfatase [Candidatus Omnitrophota bacterium]
MKTKKLLDILSITAVSGFLLGASLSIHYILVNRYLQYKMFRLAFSTLKERLNQNMLGAIIAILVFYFFWILLVEKLKVNRKTTIALIFAAAILLFLDHLFKTFTAFTLLSGVKTLLIIIRDILVGATPIKYLLNTAQKYSVFILTVSLCVIACALGGWRLIKSKKQKLSLSKKEGFGLIRRIALAMVSFTVVLNTALFAYGYISVPAGPNIVIILSDALRRDHLSLYGYHKKTSPNIDRFAEGATVFKNAVSQSSWTLSSVASLFTSLYVSVHGVVRQGETEGDCLDYRLVTLAELLKNKGYKTAAFIENPMISRGLRFHQGFDVFKLTVPMIELAEYKPRPSELNKIAFPWIKKQKKKPFFVYVHYLDPHAPYAPIEPFASVFGTTDLRKLEDAKPDRDTIDLYINNYDGEILYIDHLIGQLLGHLKECGLTGETLIIMLADHGEGFLEHDNFAHGKTLYAEEINIPLIMKFPKSVELSDVSENRVGLIDILPTVLHVTGVISPYDYDGINLLDKTLGTDENRVIFSELLKPVGVGSLPRLAMMKGDFKAIYLTDRDQITELYDLDKDKEERDNILVQNPQIEEGFKKEIDLWREEKARKKQRLCIKNSSVTLRDEKRVKQLRALGYLQ